MTLSCILYCLQFPSNFSEREESTCTTSCPLGVTPMCCNVSVPGTFMSLLCVLDRKLNCGPGLRMLCRCVVTLSVTNYSPADIHRSAANIKVDLKHVIRPECPGAIWGIEGPVDLVHVTSAALSGLTRHHLAQKISFSLCGSDEVRCFCNSSAWARTQCTSVFSASVSSCKWSSKKETQFTLFGYKLDSLTLQR